MGKKKVQKQKQEKVKETHTIGTAVKWVLFFNHLILCYLFYFDESISSIGITIMVGLLISAVYWFFHRHTMFTSTLVENGIRYVLSYVLMTMTVFFYSIAMYRSGDLTSTMEGIIIGASFFVWYCLYSASQGLIKK